MNDWLGDMVMMPMTISENKNRGIAFLTGVYDSMMKRGFTTVGEAQRAGKWTEILDDGFKLDQQVNFIYGALGQNPYWTRNPVLRSTMLFTTFPRGMAENYLRWGREGNVHAAIAYTAVTGYLANLARKAGVETYSWLNPVANVMPAPGYGGQLLGGMPGGALTGMLQFIHGASIGDASEQDQGWSQFAQNAAPLAWWYADAKRAKQRFVEGFVKEPDTGLLQGWFNDKTDFWNGWVRNTRGDAVRKSERTFADFMEIATGLPSSNLTNLRDIKTKGRLRDDEMTAAAQNLADDLYPILLAFRTRKMSPEETGKKEREAQRIYARAAREGVNIPKIITMARRRVDKRRPLTNLSSDEEFVRRTYPEYYYRERREQRK